MSIRITAAIPTCNRLPYLRRALQSLVDQNLAADSFEILIVDNASTDGTGAYVQAEADRTPNVSYLFAPEPGLSKAKNMAVQNARGEFIAFLDDDAIASPDWLNRILDAFSTGSPRPVLLGGKTEPIWEVERPRWLSDEALGAFAIIDWMSEPGYLTDGQYLVGANVAYRTEVLRSVNGFPEHLGRVGTSLRSGEETYVQGVLEEKGHFPYYDPAVVVQHCVQASRVNREWLLQRAYWQGFSDAEADAEGTPSSTVATIRRILTLSFRLILFPVRLIRPTLADDPAERFDQRCAAMRAAAELSIRLNLQMGLQRYKEGT
jgi:glycosyltransferase involved in cell wall biosynthesis